MYIYISVAYPFMFHLERVYANVRREKRTKLMQKLSLEAVKVGKEIAFGQREVESNVQDCQSFIQSLQEYGSEAKLSIKAYVCFCFFFPLISTPIILRCDLFCFDIYIMIVGWFYVFLFVFLFSKCD